MEEHGDLVGEPDDARSDEGSDDGAPSDYLESLRARFDELASRIETATQESLERTHSLLTEPDDEADDSAVPVEPPPSPSAPVDNGTPPPPEAAVVDPTPAPDVATEAKPDSRFRAPPPVLGREPSRDVAAPPPPPPPPAPAPEPAAQPRTKPEPVAPQGPQARPEPVAPREPEARTEPVTPDEPEPTPDPVVPAAAATTTADDKPDVAPISYDVVNTETLAHDADLDAWDETAPPADPVKVPRKTPDQQEITDPATLGAQLRSNVHPVTTRDRGRRFIVPALVVVALLAAVAVGGWFLLGGGDDAAPAAAPAESTASSTTLAETAPSGPTPQEIETSARQALADAGLTDISVEIEGSTAILTGISVSEEEETAAGIAVLSVDGITNIDSRIDVVVPPPPDPAEVQAAAQDVLTSAGLDDLGVTVFEGTATITGVMPVAALGDGYFAYTAPARDALLTINGVDAVRTRLQLRGDQGALSAELDTLTTESPITFESGTAVLTPESGLVLDQAAVVIVDYPGPGIIVTGSIDPAGAAAVAEALARERAAVIVASLVERGVPATRLVAVPFGDAVFEVIP